VQQRAPAIEATWPDKTQTPSTLSGDQPTWHAAILWLALPAHHLPSAMLQGGQPWPAWNGALQQM